MGLRDRTFIKDYVGIHRRKDFPVKMHGVLSQYFKGILLHEVVLAAKAAYKEYDSYLERVRARGEEMIEQAQRETARSLFCRADPITWIRRSITASIS